MDRFLRIVGYVRKQKGRALLLRSNVCPILINEHGQLPLNKVVTGDELQELLRGIGPKDLSDRLAGGSGVTFHVPTPEGDVRVEVILRQGRPEVTLYLVDDTITADPAFAVRESLVTPLPVVLPAPGLPTVTSPGGALPAAPTAPPRELPPVTAPYSPAPTVVRGVDYPADYLPRLFGAALRVEASDIYLQANAKPWGRIQGEIQPLDFGHTLGADPLRALLFEAIPAEKRGQWVESGTVEFTITFEDRIRVRCHLFEDSRGVGAAMRLLPIRPPSLADLNAPGLLADLVRAERGLLVVGGVRSSGVSTTLASLVQAIANQRRARIVTVENPMEYLHRSDQAMISQMEIPTHVPDAVTALQRMSQGNVDVCALDPVKNRESWKAAVALAETGVLVLATVKLPDVPAVAERLVESVDTVEGLLRVLRGIVCQRLVRPRTSGPLFAVFEALTPTPGIASLIRQKKFRELHGGMFLTFDAALAGAVRDNRITREEAFRHTSDPDNLRRALT